MKTETMKSYINQISTENDLKVTKEVNEVCAQIREMSTDELKALCLEMVPMVLEMLND